MSQLTQRFYPAGFVGNNDPKEYRRIARPIVFQAVSNAHNIVGKSLCGSFNASLNLRPVYF